MAFVSDNFFDQCQSHRFEVFLEYFIVAIGFLFCFHGGKVRKIVSPGQSFLRVETLQQIRSILLFPKDVYPAPAIGSS